MSSNPHHPFGFSQIPGKPSFRSSAVNAVALVPLLSSSSSTQGKDQNGAAGSHSAKSFRQLWHALARHTTVSQSSLDQSLSSCENNDLLLVVSNKNLTRPGDWKYQETPLKAFHWQYGCQRLQLFDGRADTEQSSSKLAQDRLLNPSVTRDWIDLCPARRTAAVIGVLNIRDCQTQEDWKRAQEELHHWATQRYATPPYQVTAHGHTGIERDQPVERLFVFDSFDEDCQHIDLSQTTLLSTSAILAFPPSDEAHSQMMDLHLNVVVNDLAVAIFRSLESRIRQSDLLLNNKTAKDASSAKQPSQKGMSRYISGGSTEKESGNEEAPSGAAANLSLQSMAELVGPNKLNQDSSTASDDAVKIYNSTNGATPPTSEPKSSTAANLRRLNSGVSGSGGNGSNNQGTPPHLLTPLDDYYEWSTSALSTKDTAALKRRDMGRREKMAADLSLLAGSPLDAYERYLKAAHMSKAHPDPLWYAMSLVGCAAAHIAMAECGGYNVDEYLANNFSLPEDILTATGNTDMTGSSVKQTLPEVVFALCEEAQDILNRHRSLAPFLSGLLLQLALYTAESAESHLRCRWGEGPGGYAGGEDPPYRWENPAASLGDDISKLKTKDDRDMISINFVNRTKTICELLQKAVSVADLDEASRLDVASRSVRLCLEGIPGTKWKPNEPLRVQLPRKAAYFSVVAAESVSSMHPDTDNPLAENLWLLASQLYSWRKNDAPGKNTEGESYAWATLRASTLHALSMQGTGLVCLEASQILFSLLEHIKPVKKPAKKASNPATPTRLNKTASESVTNSTHGTEANTLKDTVEEGGYEKARRMIRESFNQATGASSLLATQSKWATENPKRPVDLPLSQNSQNILALGAVWSGIDYRVCASAQKQCAERIKALKRSVSMSTLPSNDEQVLSSSTSVANPISLDGNWSLKSYDGSQEIELVKRKVEAEADKGSMATFYNPFAKSGKRQEALPIAAEEQRVITLSLANSLSIAVSIKKCELTFSNSMQGRIHAAPVSFSIPPQAKHYIVQFPFTIVENEETESIENDDSALGVEEFEVTGISYTCLNQAFSLSFGQPKRNAKSLASSVAKPASYSYISKKSNKSSENTDTTAKIEALPCQPRLTVRHADAGHVLAPSSKLSLRLTDGQTLTTPTFELINDAGPKGQGTVHRIKVTAIGLGGSAEKMIYDSATTAADREALDAAFSDDTNTPMKARLLPGIPIDINEMNSSESPHQRIGFQVVVGNKLREKLGSNSQLTFRIRYSGKPTKLKEVWRKFDLTFALVVNDGPTITGLCIRPDLSEEAPHPLLLKRLQERRRFRGKDTGKAIESKEVSPTCRLGLDNSVHAISSNVIAVVSVFNETDSNMMLSRSNGSSIVSLSGQPLDTILVPAGITVNVPISLPRIPRFNENGSLTADFINATNLGWKCVEDSPSPVPPAQGTVSLKQDILETYYKNKPSVIPSIFAAPCQISLEVGNSVVKKGFSKTISPAEAVDISVAVKIAPWVSVNIFQQTKFTLELFAANMDESKPTNSRDHLWNGLVKRTFSLEEMESKHSASVIFLSRGVFALSACARFSQGNEGDEVWWAPASATITCNS